MYIFYLGFTFALLDGVVEAFGSSWYKSHYDFNFEINMC